MFSGDIFFFCGAFHDGGLGFTPHRKIEELRLRFGYLDFVLCSYGGPFCMRYIVLPWMYALPSLGEYNHTYNLITNVQNLVTVACLGFLWVRPPERGNGIAIVRRSTLHMLSSLAINVGVDSGEYYTGSLYDCRDFVFFLVCDGRCHRLRSRGELAAAADRDDPKSSMAATRRACGRRGPPWPQ